MITNRFESECWNCGQRIVTSDGGASWKHRPAWGRRLKRSLMVDKHPAHPHGDMKQI